MRILGVCALFLTATVGIWAQGSGELCVKTSTGRAGVFVDGRYLGPAANFRIARTYSVPAGEHELRISDPRYEDMVRKITITAGQKLTVREALKPLAVPNGPFGRVRVRNADKFAPVYINLKYFGHVDEFSNSSQGILLPPGEYEVKIEPASGATITKKVKVEANQTVIVE